MKKSLLLTLLISVIVAAVSCRKEPEAPPEVLDTPATVVLRGNAVWIDDPTAQSLTSVDSNQVVFNGNTDQLSSLAVGSIIVSGIIENAPVGFCRRITQIDQSGTLYTLATEEVSLTEVFEELHVQFARTFGLEDTARSGPVFTVNLPDVVLYDADGSSATTMDQVRVNGSVDVSPTLTVEIDIAQGQLHYSKIGGQVECELSNTVSLGGSIGLFSAEVSIYEQPLAPFNIPGTPVVIVPVLLVKVGAEGDVQVEVTAGYSSSTNASAYLEYSGGAWQTSFSRSMSNTHALSDINGQVSAMAYVGPGLDFRFWGNNRWRGYVETRAYLSALATLIPNPGCEVKAGIRGGVGANLRLFRTDLLSVSYPSLFDYSTVLYQCGGQPLAPVSSFTGSPTSLAVGSSVSFTDLSSGSPTSWQWSFPGGTPSNSTLQSPTVVYNNPGQYDATLNVSNAVGSNSLTRPAYINVSAGGSAPVADFVASQTTVEAGQPISFTDLSSGNPGSWEWSFSGAVVNSSTVQNPAGVVYSMPGTYTVSLLSSNGFGSNMEIKTDYITVTQQSSGCSGLSTVTDIDGNIYPVVTIGNQCWMAANLKTTRYRDGSSIPNVPNATDWNQLAGGAAWCNYNNDPSLDVVYGKIYNWFAVADVRGLCPENWHVPTEVEWRQLESALGMPDDVPSNVSWVGIEENVGGKLKATTLWDVPNTGATNESGFSGLPCGVLIETGSAPLGFYSIGTTLRLWSASEASVPGGIGARIRILSSITGGISRIATLKHYGSCVRCIRD